LKEQITEPWTPLSAGMQAGSFVQTKDFVHWVGVRSFSGIV